MAFYLCDVWDSTVTFPLKSTLYSIAGKGTTESRESWGFADNNTHPNNVDLIVIVVGVE